MKRNVLFKIINNYLYDSYLSINLNYWYNFGSILGVFLILQIITGIILSMNYVATFELAFESVQYIKRELKYGRILQSLHSNGAFFFFLIVYLHIARALLYGSYSFKRIGTWYIGVIILLLMIITAFLGYSLPLGNMSLWAIAVITNLLSVIPYFGRDIVVFIYGGYNISDSTLGRFYTLHYLLPIIIALFSLLHLILLHNKGGSNPLGVNSIKNMGSINFHPYYTFKDLYGFFLAFFFFFLLVFFYPDFFSHSDNSIEANPLITPPHIVPEAYLLPFYSILRAIPNKTIGVIALLGSIMVLLVLPFIHLGIINSSKFRPFYLFFLYIFFLVFLLLIHSGGCLVAEPYISISQLLTLYYFSFFLLLLPFLSFFESFFFHFLSSYSPFPLPLSL